MADKRGGGSARWLLRKICARVYRKGRWVNEVSRAWTRSKGGSLGHRGSSCWTHRLVHSFGLKSSVCMLYLRQIIYWINVFYRLNLLSRILLTALLKFFVCFLRCFGLSSFHFSGIYTLRCKNAWMSFMFVPSLLSCLFVIWRVWRCCHFR